MNYGVAGVVGAIATLVAVVSTAIATWRKSKAEAEKSWQDMMRGQLEWQINRNDKLEEIVLDLRQQLEQERSERRRQLDAERAERLRSEAALNRRIGVLEAFVRDLGHDPEAIR